MLSNEIADIFRSNALKNGLLAVVVSDAEHRWLLEHPGIELLIDVAGGFIELPDGGRFGFEIDAFARHCLLRAWTSSASCSSRTRPSPRTNNAAGSEPA